MSGEDGRELYTNDIVYRLNRHKHVVFGTVIDTYEASTEVDEYHALQKGQARILWSNNSREQVWAQERVRLVNRSIIPGDIVRRVEKGKETQRGYCKEAKQIATVQIVGTDKVIEHVPSERLKSLRPFNEDDAVCLGSKYGRIEAIDQVVSMQSKCGSIVDVVTSINHEDLDDYWLSKRNRLSLDSFYPGQEIICVPSSLEQPNWTKKSKTMKRNMQTRQRFTIQSVEEYLIEVAWQQDGANYNHVEELNQDEIKQLKVLEHPNDTCLELGDRRLLKLKSSDVLVKKKDWIRKLSYAFRPDFAKIPRIIVTHLGGSKKIPKYRTRMNPLPALIEQDDEWWTDVESESEFSSNTSIYNGSRVQKRYYPPKMRELVPGNALPVEIICVESKITVVWQDGVEEVDIPSVQLCYSVSLDDHEFFPGEWVVCDSKEDNGQYGVVQSVNYCERTALVKWYTYNEEERKPKELSINEMSVYDLKKHSKFVFRPGSIVKSKPVQDNRMGKVIDSCVEGYIRVKWLDGSEENCWPQDIELIPESTEFDFTDDESSDDEAQVSWETESIESYAGDVTDETALQNMAARLDFVRSRIIYLKNAFSQHTISENFSFLRDLLLVYDNSSYLDKLLGTSFFSLKSKHFQALLSQAKERAKALGIELKGRLFSNDSLCPSLTKVKVAEKENMNKLIKLENKVQTQLERRDSVEIAPNGPKTPSTPDSSEFNPLSHENLCVELLSMLKIRMDLAYAEIISKIGGPPTFSVLTKATENAASPTPSSPLASIPVTPDESFSTLSPLKPKKKSDDTSEAYSLIEDAPASHHYFSGKFEPTDMSRFIKAVQKEYKLLKESLPPGVWVRSYGNRIDLLSVMIRGPAKTPYEDGLFLFDIQLSQDYPRSPPLVHYISYSSERLNPNLYVEGKVCVSLLGTWMGRGTEVWGPNSTLLQLIVSIQGLILVSEPYYNEAGFEKQSDTQQGVENSRTYNELVLLKMVQSMTALLKNPPEVFKQEILDHFRQNGRNLCERLRRFCSDTNPLKPEFTLLPVSKGLKLSLSSALSAFHEVLSACTNVDKDMP